MLWSLVVGSDRGSASFWASLSPFHSDPGVVPQASEGDEPQQGLQGAGAAMPGQEATPALETPAEMPPAQVHPVPLPPFQESLSVLTGLKAPVRPEASQL